MQGIYPGSVNPGQMSPEVQNRGITGPTKRTYALQKILKREKSAVFLHCCIVLIILLYLSTAESPSYFPHHTVHLKSIPSHVDVTQSILKSSSQKHLNNVTFVLNVLNGKTYSFLCFRAVFGGY